MTLIHKLRVRAEGHPLKGLPYCRTKQTKQHLNVTEKWKDTTCPKCLWWQDDPI